MNNRTKMLLLVAALFLLFTSCSQSTANDTSDSTDKNSADTADIAETPAEELPNYLTLEGDLGGEAFRVLGMYSESYKQFSNFEIYAESENGDIVNDAVYRRNSIIEEKYNVKIEQVLGEMTLAQSNTPLLQLMQKNTMAGDDAYELFFIPLRDISGVISGNLAQDMYPLPYIDFDEDYWNLHTNINMEIKGKLFLTNSDFSLMDKRRTYILIYNRDLHKEYSDLVIEDAINNGSWTYDVMTELMENISVDLNGDGMIDYNDQWGVGMDSQSGILALAIGMGGHTVLRDSDGIIINNLLDEKMINIATRINDTLRMGTTNGFFCAQYGWNIPGVPPAGEASHMFNNEQVLFMTGFPQQLSSLSQEVTFDYGVIPFPKYDEVQEDYYTFADCFGSVLFGVPLVSAKTDMTGFMLEVLSGYSTDTTLEAYYELSCKVKHVYDETSAEMLDLCFEGITFDLGTMFKWGNMNHTAFRNLMINSSNTYVSDCEAIMDIVDNDIKTMLDAVK